MKKLTIYIQFVSAQNIREKHWKAKSHNIIPDIDVRIDYI